MSIIIGLVHYPNNTFLQNYNSLRVFFYMLISRLDYSNEGIEVSLRYTACKLKRMC